MRKIKIFSGTVSKELTTKVCSYLKIPMGKVKLEKFSDGEFQPQYEENLRGRDVFIIQSTPPPFENWGELFMMIDAAKRSSAHRIIVILPFFGLSRQDRKDKPRVGIASKLMSDFLTVSGATRVVSIDLHADQIGAFFNIPFDQLFGTYVFWPQIQKMIKDGIVNNLQFASPDNGGVKRMTRYAEKFDTDYVICSKIRKKKNEVASMTLVGDVTDRDVVLIDDMGDTLNTICTAADLMIEKGANTVRACLTHPILSGKALETLEKSKITEIFVLDTIPLKFTSPKITVLSCSEMLAKAIKKIDQNKSLSSLFLK